MKTGTIKKRITVDFGRGIDGKYEDSFREPEGAFLYKDPYTKKKSLFCVVVTGAEGKRVSKVYAYHQRDNYEKFASEMNQWSQTFPLTGAGGSTKGIPVSYTKLSEIISAGYYYMNAEESAKYTDHPEPGAAGWHLEVSPITPFGVILQKLTRNSTGRTIKKYERNLNLRDGLISAWYIPTANQTLEWTAVPLKNGAKNMPDAPLQFALNGGLCIVHGYVDVDRSPAETVFATLPKGIAPSRATYFLCSVAGTSGMHKIHVRPETGEIVALGTNVNDPNAATFTYVDFMFSWA